MTKLYQKDEVWFAIVWIIAYIVGTSIFDGFDTKVYTLLYHVLMTEIIVYWLNKNGLLVEYGLCKPMIESKRMLYYLPMLLFVTCNFWFGVQLQLSVIESIYYALSMLFVGFIEEMIFRGFLFKAMSKDNLKMAILVSSITFGVGHIINLFNGSGAELLANVCQIGYAITFGYLAVWIFLKTKSLWPCIFVHSIMNAMSVFSNVDVLMQDTIQVIVSVILFFTALFYALYIKNLA